MDHKDIKDTKDTTTELEGKYLYLTNIFQTHRPSFSQNAPGPEKTQKRHETEGPSEARAPAISC